MKRLKSELTLIDSADANVDGGVPLWQSGDSHQRYAFSFTIQPQTATATLGTATSLLTANGPFGIVIGSGEALCQGNMELRGSDIAIDLSEYSVRGATDIVLLTEVPDDD